MKEINAALIACITFFSGFCASFFFMGSEESLNQVMSEYYTSFNTNVGGVNLKFDFRVNV
ncbi:hypothetical protein [Pedobacter xixiisoli]|uniref:Uncharacterized protein n=1 Tax=Pedobacter xixiisoli TaxID=1476464 RepID=A0A285ZZN4_9SPHI|nr:hypothetical protein [Pedobacter xixiisoli]SOD15105.1 hypothetical protein SAMN06297358_2080 [Pedobacter xixiisoli]